MKPYEEKKFESNLKTKKYGTTTKTTEEEPSFLNCCINLLSKYKGLHISLPLLRNWTRHRSVRKMLTWKMTGEPEKREN